MYSWDFLALNKLIISKNLQRFDLTYKPGDLDCKGKLGV